MQEQYKALAKRYHPDASEQREMDQGQINAFNEKFIQVKEAYD